MKVLWPSMTGPSDFREIMAKKRAKAKTSPPAARRKRIKKPIAIALPQRRKARLQFEWAQTITPDQWETYRSAIRALREAGIRFLLGGGFAMASYTGRWRNTKDIDLYIMAADRDKAVATLTQAGFQDYFPQRPYQRHWIYRGTRSGVIVDLIWAMANQRANVDEHWFEASPDISIRGETLYVVPMEEFIWCKLYILQRDHCDWTDVLNVLSIAGKRLDWNRLLWRLEDDWLLLKSLLTLYTWLCPRRAVQLPAFLRQKLNLEAPQIPKHPKRNRIHLLDSRGWFAASLPKNQTLEI